MRLSRACVLVVALAAFGGFGCAASSGLGAPGGPPAGDAETRRQLEEAARAMERAEAELGTARVDARPDCTRACTLQDNVCALSERICKLAARLGPGDPAAARCADGRARCQRARDAVASRCACPPPRS